MARAATIFANGSRFIARSAHATSLSPLNTAALVKAYFNYVISAEGQQVANSAAGSAPLSDSVRQKIQPAVDAIGSAS